MVGLDPTTQTFNICAPEKLVGRVKPDHGEWGMAAEIYFPISVDTFLSQVYVPVLFFMQDRNIMDWDLAIKRNSEVLIEIVADLFAMLGLVGEATVSRLPWPTYRAVLRILRPAESPPCGGLLSLRQEAL